MHRDARGGNRQKRARGQPAETRAGATCRNARGGQPAETRAGETCRNARGGNLQKRARGQPAETRAGGNLQGHGAPHGAEVRQPEEQGADERQVAAHCHGVAFQPVGHLLVLRPLLVVEGAVAVVVEAREAEQQAHLLRAAAAHEAARQRPAGGQVEADQDVDEGAVGHAVDHPELGRPDACHYETVITINT